MRTSIITASPFLTALVAASAGLGSLPCLGDQARENTLGTKKEEPQLSIGGSGPFVSIGVVRVQDAGNAVFVVTRSGISVGKLRYGLTPTTARLFVPEPQVGKARAILLRDAQEQRYRLLGTATQAEHLRLGRFVPVGASGSGMDDLDSDAYILAANRITVLVLNRIANGKGSSESVVLCVSSSQQQKAKNILRIRRQVKSHGYRLPGEELESRDVASIGAVGRQDEAKAAKVLDQHRIRYWVVGEFGGAGFLAHNRAEAARARAILRQDAKRRGYQFFGP